MLRTGATPGPGLGTCETVIMSHMYGHLNRKKIMTRDHILIIQ